MLSYINFLVLEEGKLNTLFHHNYIENKKIVKKQDELIVRVHPP